MSHRSTSEDQVVSEVNTFLVAATSEVKPIQKCTNRIAKLQFSLPKSSNSYCTLGSDDKEKITVSQKKNLEYDSDGDLMLTRTPKEVSSSTDLQERFMLIEYENSTTLGLVGLQVWRGAFLISDFILHFSQKYFQGKTVLELGSGTGLSGIVASIYAQKVIATDMNEPNILELIKANMVHNKGFVKSEFLVEPLDFMDLNWNTKIEDLVKNSDVVLAADVIYHVEITDAFIKTLKKIITTGNRPKNVFIAMEKRYVFTVSDLDTMSPMYSHFMDEMDSKLNLSPGCLPRRFEETDLNVCMKIHSLDFPQYFNYEKNKELVLLHIQTTTV